MNTHVMLDLETLSTRNNAHIVSIGAVLFNPHTEDEMAPFYMVCKNEQQEGADIDPDTVAWWATQNDQVRSVFTDANMTSLSTMLIEFRDWVGAKTSKIEGMWGNGSDFDNVILGNAYQRWGLRPPWSFGRNRCFRTMKNIALPNTFVAPVPAGTHHNALDDATYQAHYLRAIVKALNITL